MDTTPGAVVVAVGGHATTAAVEYAAAEALRRHRPLHLVHAVDPHDPEDAAAGSGLLDDAVHLANGLLGELGRVTSTLVPGAPVQAVAHAAEGAELVVVGRCPESRRTHPYVRSVTGGIGARVDTPVVSVPEGWEKQAGPSTVVAGVDEPDKRTDVLIEAFTAARDRQARLLVLCTAWHPPQTHVADPGWTQRAEDELERAIGEVGASYPEVQVEIHVRNAQAGEALIEASRHADLVVVGRHTSLLPTGSHLGPIARSVLRDADCPVLLATPKAVHRVRMAAAHRLSSAN